ncbi:hypothetical protein D9M73_206480 [compost metagenome]
MCLHPAKVSNFASVPVNASAMISPMIWLVAMPCPEYPWQYQTLLDSLPNCGMRFITIPIAQLH